MSRLTLEELPEKYRAQVLRQIEVVPHVAPKIHDNVRPSTPEPKSGVCDGTLATPRAEKGNPSFYVVRVESWRSRLLDTDNLIPKWHVDALRYAGCLPSDAPDCCQIVTTQKKVTKDQERTLITIERHDCRPE